MPALEMTIGAWMCTSSCPFMTLTPKIIKTQNTVSQSSHPGCRVCAGVGGRTKPTVSFLGVVKQDAVDGSSDQNGAACLLDDGDHVVGNFTGSAFRVPGAVQVVSDQQAVHGETSVFGHVACRAEKEKKKKSKTEFILKKKKRLMATGLQPGRTVGAKDVGEDSPQVFVVRQLVHHLCQTARCHLEEGRQTPDDAGVDQELGHGGGEELQQSEGPNTVANSLQVNVHGTLDDELLKEPIIATRDDECT